MELAAWKIRGELILHKIGSLIVANKRLLIILSTIVVVLAIASTLCFPTEKYSALGSVFAAAAGMLAVIWFSASLYNQSQELKEQREQFSKNFKQLQEDNRRSSLVVVKDILSRAEERALKCNPNLTCIDDLRAQYIDMDEWPTILKSTDPNEVIKLALNWKLTKEEPALFLMRGIKSAAETYFRAIGRTDIDYSIEPELFVAEHGPTLWKLPYFEEYQTAAAFVSELMVPMKESRAAIEMAYLVALCKKTSENRGVIMIPNSTIEKVVQHKKAGYELPLIAKDLPTDQTVVY